VGRGETEQDGASSDPCDWREAHAAEPLGAWHASACRAGRRPARGRRGRVYHEDRMTINVIAQRLAEEPSAWLYNRERWGAREARLGSSRESEGCGREPGGLSGPGRRRAGRFVQSGRTTFFPVPVLRTSTTGRTDTFFPELNEPARPAAARPASRDAGGQAASGCAVRTERRGQDRRKTGDSWSMIGPAGG